MAEDRRFLDCGVQRLGDGTDLRDRGIAGRRSRRSIGSCRHSGCCLASGDALTTGDRTDLRCSAGHAWQGSARAGSLQLPLRDDRVVACHLDVDAVF